MKSKNRTCDLIQSGGHKPADLPLRHLGSQRRHLVLPGQTWREAGISAGVSTPAVPPPLCQSGVLAREESGRGRRTDPCTPGLRCAAACWISPGGPSKSRRSGCPAPAPGSDQRRPAPWTCSSTDLAVDTRREDNETRGEQLRVRPTAAEGRVELIRILLLIIR